MKKYNFVNLWKVLCKCLESLHCSMSLNMFPPTYLHNLWPDKVMKSEKTAYKNLPWVSFLFSGRIYVRNRSVPFNSTTINHSSLLRLFMHFWIYLNNMKCLHSIISSHCPKLLQGHLRKNIAALHVWWLVVCFVRSVYLPFCLLFFGWLDLLYIQVVLLNICWI